MNITLKHDGTLVFQKDFTSMDLQYIKSVGMRRMAPLSSRYSMAFGAPVYSMSKESVWNLMWNSFPYLFYKENLADTRKLCDAIADYYRHYYMQFKQMARSNVPWFDDLYKHQQEAVFLGMCRKYNIFAHEQGLGKSITSITVSKILNCQKTLIICPAICKWNWYEEITDTWGISRDEVTLVDTRKTINASREKIVIINYDLLHRRIPALHNRAFDHIILDEAHYIKSTASKRHKACAKLVSLNKQSKISFLTGTPIKNRVEDLYAYLKLIQHPLGDNKTNFIKRFTCIDEGDKKKVKNPLWLRQLLSNVMHRLTKDKCLSLPDKIYTKFLFEFNDYEADYNKALQTILESKNLSSSTSVDLAFLTLNRITSQSKVPHCIAQAERIISGGEKIILFSVFKDTIKKLKAHFGDRAVVIDGSVPTEKRQDTINKFKTDESVTVFIGQTIAAGVGINLTNCSNAMLCDLPLTHAELHQAIDRIHRIGQSKSPNIYFALCKGTIDTKLFRLIQAKERDAALVLDGKKPEHDYGKLMASVLADELKKIADAKKIEELLKGSFLSEAEETEEEGEGSGGSHEDQQSFGERSEQLSLT